MKSGILSFGVFPDSEIDSDSELDSDFDRSDDLLSVKTW